MSQQITPKQNLEKFLSEIKKFLEIDYPSGSVARYHKVEFVLNSPNGRTHGSAPTINPGDLAPKQTFGEFFRL